MTVEDEWRWTGGDWPDAARWNPHWAEVDEMVNGVEEVERAWDIDEVVSMIRSTLRDVTMAMTGLGAAATAAAVGLDSLFGEADKNPNSSNSVKPEAPASGAVSA